MNHDPLDYPTPEQLNESLKNIPQRKISPEEQKKIDQFVQAVYERGKKLAKQNQRDKHSH